MKSNQRLEADAMTRLTFLVSAEVKRELAQLCAQEDLTTSQVLRRLIAAYLERSGASTNTFQDAGSRAARKVHPST